MVTRNTTNRSPARRSPHAPPRRWASIYGVADYMGVHERTVRNMIARGQLTAYRNGELLIRLDINEVDALLEAGA